VAAYFSRDITPDYRSGTATATCRTKDPCIPAFVRPKGPVCSQRSQLTQSPV
jgi:hypothetical protein